MKGLQFIILVAATLAMVVADAAPVPFQMEGNLSWNKSNGATKYEARYKNKTDGGSWKNDITSSTTLPFKTTAKIGDTLTFSVKACRPERKGTTKLVCSKYAFLDHIVGVNDAPKIKINLPPEMPDNLGITINISIAIEGK